MSTKKRKKRTSSKVSSGTMAAVTAVAREAKAEKRERALAYLRLSLSEKEAAVAQSAASSALGGEVGYTLDRKQLDQAGTLSAAARRLREAMSLLRGGDGDRGNVLRYLRVGLAWREARNAQWRAESDLHAECGYGLLPEVEGNIGAGHAAILRLREVIEVLEAE